jgi:hypothetical protein
VPSVYLYHPRCAGDGVGGWEGDSIYFMLSLCSLCYLLYGVKGQMVRRSGG